jgi:hypothetical protein
VGVDPLTTEGSWDQQSNRNLLTLEHLLIDTRRETTQRVKRVVRRCSVGISQRAGVAWFGLDLIARVAEIKYCTVLPCCFMRVASRN